MKKETEYKKDPKQDLPTKEDTYTALCITLLEKIYDDDFMYALREVTKFAAEEIQKEKDSDQHLCRELLKLSDQIDIILAIMARNQASHVGEK